MPGLTLTAKVGVDGRGFQNGMNRVKSSASSTASSIGKSFAGIFTAGVLFRGFKKVLDDMGKIRDKARGVGLTSKEFQALDFAAQQTGTSVENITKAIRVLSKAQMDANEGGSEYVDSFKRLGISADDLASKAPQDIFDQLASNAENGSIGVQNMADLLNVLGRNATEILPAMVDGIATTTKQFEELNLAIEDETVESLAALGDEWVTLGARIKKVFAEVAIYVVAVFKEAMNAVMAGVSAVAGFIEAFQSNPKSLLGKINDLSPTGLIAGLITKRGAVQDGLRGGRREFDDEAARQVEQEEKDKEFVAARVALRKRQAENARKLGGEIQGDIAKSNVKIENNAFKPSSDALSKIGGFVGPGRSNVENYQKRTAVGVEQTKLEVERLRREMKF